MDSHCYCRAICDLVWILKATFNVLLLILAGVLIALYFHGLSSLINESCPSQKRRACYFYHRILYINRSFFWFAGGRIQEQVTELKDTLPAAFENFKEKVNNSTIGKELLDKITSMPDTSKAASTITSFFSSTFGVLGDLYVVLFLGIFFIASPSIYINGILKLVPTRAKSEAENILKEIGYTLTKWLKGKIFSMFVVFVLTALGLLILGVPLWLVLSLVAGLLSFVPNFGPILALIPAVLVALWKAVQLRFWF